MHATGNRRPGSTKRRALSAHGTAATAMQRKPPTPATPATPRSGSGAGAGAGAGVPTPHSGAAHTRSDHGGRGRGGRVRGRGQGGGRGRGRGRGGGGKRQRGGPSTSRFLTPMDLEYRGVLRTVYQGFYVDDASVVPAATHKAIRKCLLQMERNGFFHFDVLQTKSAVSSTFVRRTLLGRAGMTYHYQGLRLFAHPWSDKLKPFAGLSQALQTAAVPHVATETKRRPDQAQTSTEFNVTLINLMDPNEELPTALRQEPEFGMGLTSVSWHSDSSLQAESTIGVYHVTDQESDWAVGLRAIGALADAPAVRVPLPSRAAYFMCGDFNATHHHAVLTGTSRRFSLTYRVAVEKKDTLQYMAARCLDAQKQLAELLASGATAAGVDAKAIHAVQAVHTELEFQWLRQFWLQGLRHADLHTYWRARMAELEAVFWELEAGLARVIGRLAAVAAAPVPGVTKRSFDLLVYYLTDRAEQRAAHDERRAHPVYGRLAAEDQPVDAPTFTATRPLPRQLSPVVRRLRSLQAAFVANTAAAAAKA